MKNQQKGLLSKKILQKVQSGIVVKVCGKNGHSYFPILLPNGEHHIFCTACGGEVKFV